MRSGKTGAFIALAGLAVAVVLFVVLSGDDGDEGPDTTTQATTTVEQEPAAEEPGTEKQEQKRKPKPQKPELPTLKIRGGEPVGGVAEFEFASGGRIEFLIDADTEDELHFHGYDEYIDVGPGKPAKVNIKATIEGIFELESHSTGALLARVSVVP